MKKNKFKQVYIQSSVFVPEQQWRLSQEINLFTLFSCEDKVHNQGRLFVTKIRGKNVIFKNDEEFSTLIRSSCFNPFSPRKQFKFQQPVIFCHEFFASNRKAMTWSYMELIKLHTSEGTCAQYTSPLPKTKHHLHEEVTIYE